MSKAKGLTRKFTFRGHNLEKLNEIASGPSSIIDYLPYFRGQIHYKGIN